MKLGFEPASEDHGSDRGLITKPGVSLICYFLCFQHLTLLDARDDKWRALRKSLSPTFTSGKLKGMLQHMEAVADNMIECLKEKSQQVPISPTF